MGENLKVVLFYFPYWTEDSQIYYVSVGWLICTVNDHHVLFGLMGSNCLLFSYFFQYCHWSINYLKLERNGPFFAILQVRFESDN